MPNFDKTGPLGKGAMFGRKRGFCRSEQNNNSENPLERTKRTDEETDYNKENSLQSRRNFKKRKRIVLKDKKIKNDKISSRNCAM